MIFKRRDPKPTLRALAEFLWPRGGWTRAFHYVKHRMRRLPDSPERIARGIWAGVFTTFTPFYGLHFIVAALIGRVMRANILAALMATFFGNPLTYVPIGIAALQTGHWILGAPVAPEVLARLGSSLMFELEARGLWHWVPLVAAAAAGGVGARAEACLGALRRAAALFSQQTATTAAI